MDIAPGLSGIVGPNGCGKSNVVEALRWVMGENSAKRMRGDGMEDVIFNGTDRRPARNIAEVSLLLDNSSRSAPAAYNGSDEIEVTRKIARDQGSLYKINGKTVRARDVQMLFADTVTGANSPALVSQGRVTQIINSKPHDRRLILEESAGISGLYARRHEAELRLKAADANMLRLEDILGGMEGRLNALKRQARQASRYRNINAQIRQLEILVAWLEWRTLEKRIEAARETFTQAESMVAEKMATVTQLTRTQNTQAEDLPPLRQKEAEISAALQSHKITLQRLDDETSRLEQSVRVNQEQLEQTLLDQTHENDTVNEATSGIERLENEQATLVTEQDSEEGRLEEKEALRNTLEEKVIQLEEQYTALMQSAAESRARKQSLEQQIEQNNARIDTIRARKSKASEDLSQLPSAENATSNLKEKQQVIIALEETFRDLREQEEKAQDTLQAAQSALNDSRAVLTQAESRQSEFTAEIAMLESFFREEKEGRFKPVISQVNADSGFEKALSRAMGDALLGALEDDAPVRWRGRPSIKNLPPLPKGANALLNHVKAPKELHLALSQIGIVENESEGARLAEELAVGQSLVSQSGTYWRWDGFTVQAEATDRNTLHLEHKNRLQELQKKRSDIEQAVADAKDALDAAKTKLSETEQSRRDIAAQIRTADEQLAEGRSELARVREQLARSESEHGRLHDLIKLADEDIATLEEVVKWDRERLKAYEQDTLDQKEQDTEKLKQALTEARDAYNVAVRAFDTFQQQQNSRKARLHAIADERINLQNRLIRSRERMKQLEARQESLTAKLEELKNQPQDFSEQRQSLMSKISEMESQRNDAADALAVIEREVGETNRALKEAEGLLSSARETRASVQATHAVLEEQKGTMQQAIVEQFSVQPTELPEHVTIDAEDAEQPPENLEGLKAKKEKLSRERENLGAVNLRADEEAQALEGEVGGLLNERNDLAQAIDELRGAINKINAEARERLLAAFDTVNGHFQQLFSRLFAGGKAHLALIDSQDPLEGGLEIFAQPPGKTLQSLSLLSGGEQTLASIALIFAMFLTNPSPICVLDEIDAPLDDANVDRVCDLLEHIAKRGETRFLIITHHRLTMARMDRLYGVTMAERGVSQLVSVDLQQSFNFLEAA